SLSPLAMDAGALLCLYPHVCFAGVGGRLGAVVAGLLRFDENGPERKGGRRAGRLEPDGSVGTVAIRPGRFGNPVVDITPFCCETKRRDIHNQVPKTARPNSNSPNRAIWLKPASSTAAFALRTIFIEAQQASHHGAKPATHSREADMRVQTKESASIHSKGR